jgi:MoaA/NifB/PqqE/SkfB family radical SAM enzyme
MWSLGCKAVNFTGGGEPLAHPDAVNIIKYASEKGLSVGLITNGSLLTPEGAIILADSCAWIRISLDAADPLRFSLVHGVEPSEYDIVLENIKYLAGIKDRKAVVGVGILTEEAMRNDIVKSAGIVKSLGCDYVQFRPFDTSRDDVSKEIETAKRLYESNSFSVNSNLYRYANLTNNIKRTHSTCYAQNFWTIINAQGYVQICCDQRLDNGRIGDLNKQTFSEVWHGDRRKAVIESIDCMRDCPPDCRMNAHNVMLEHFAEPICHEAHL